MLSTTRSFDRGQLTNGCLRCTTGVEKRASGLLGIPCDHVIKDGSSRVMSCYVHSVIAVMFPRMMIHRGNKKKHVPWKYPYRRWQCCSHHMDWKEETTHGSQKTAALMKRGVKIPTLEADWLTEMPKWVNKSFNGCWAQKTSCGR